MRGDVDFILKAMGGGGGLTVLCPLMQGQLLFSLQEMGVARVDWLCQTPLRHLRSSHPLGVHGAPQTGSCAPAACWPLSRGPHLDRVALEEEGLTSPLSRSPMMTADFSQSPGYRCGEDGQHWRVPCLRAAEV